MSKYFIYQPHIHETDAVAGGLDRADQDRLVGRGFIGSAGAPFHAGALGR